MQSLVIAIEANILFVHAALPASAVAKNDPDAVASLMCVVRARLQACRQNRLTCRRDGKHCVAVHGGDRQWERLYKASIVNF